MNTNTNGVFPPVKIKLGECEVEMHRKTEGKEGALFQARRILFSCRIQKGHNSSKHLPNGDGPTEAAGWLKDNERAQTKACRKGYVHLPKHVCCMMFIEHFFHLLYLNSDQICRTFPPFTPGKMGCVIQHNSAARTTSSLLSFRVQGLHIPFLCQTTTYPEKIWGYFNWKSAVLRVEGVSAWQEPQGGQMQHWDCRLSPCWERTGSSEFLSCYCMFLNVLLTSVWLLLRGLNTCIYLCQRGSQLYQLFSSPSSTI